MRFPTTSQPAPTWDRHLDSDAIAERETQPGEWVDVTQVLQGRDPGDEDDGRRALENALARIREQREASMARFLDGY